MKVEVINLISNDALLKKAFNYLINHNQSKKAPYHNNKHAMFLCDSIHEILSEDNTGEDIDYTEKRELYLAAIFHDFNHSQGLRTDDDNIRVAINEFLLFTKRDDVKPIIKNEPIELVKVIEIIQATRYPYIIPSKELTYQQKVIKDSDINHILELNKFFYVMIDLKDEMFNDSSWSEFFEGNTVFVKQLQFETTYMKNKYTKKIETSIAFINIMNDLFE